MHDLHRSLAGNILDRRDGLEEDAAVRVVAPPADVRSRLGLGRLALGVVVHVAPVVAVEHAGAVVDERR
eukprot:5657850-Prymnesium_polylepis.1